MRADSCKTCCFNQTFSSLFSFTRKQKHVTSHPRPNGTVNERMSQTTYLPTLTNPSTIVSMFPFFVLFIFIILLLPLFCANQQLFRAEFSHVSVLIYLWFNTKQAHNSKESVKASRSISDFPSDMFAQREKLRLVGKARKA